MRSKAAPEDVEPPHNLFLQPVSIGRLFCLDHSLRQIAQLVWIKRATFAGLSGKFNDPVLFRLCDPNSPILVSILDRLAQLCSTRLKAFNE